MRWRRALMGQPGTQAAERLAAGDSARTPPPPDDGALVAVRELDAAVQALREVLAGERSRVRPDAWESAWRSTETAGELRDGWPEMVRTRGDDALALLELLQQRIMPALQDFLAVPDSFKPAAADDLHAVLSRWEREVLRRAGRLARVYSARLQARAELPGDLS